MSKWLFNAFLLALFVALAYHVAGSFHSDFFGFQYKQNEVSWTTFLAISLTTIIGATIGVLYEFLDKETDSQVAWWTTMAHAFRSRRFGLSLLATPLVVFLVFDQLYSSKADVGIALFCLQSGFFWDRTLKAVSEAAFQGSSTGSAKS